MDMCKKLTAIILSLVFLLALFPVIPASAAETDEQELISAISDLLDGCGFYPEYAGTQVAQWSDETVADMIFGKLMRFFYWPDTSAAQQLGLVLQNSDVESYSSFALESVDKLTRDTLGREYPRDVVTGWTYVSGTELLFSPSIGESTQLLVQEVSAEGDIVTATGLAVHQYVAYNETLGYFKAVCRKNPDSVYGFTLVSLEALQENRTEIAVTVSASSELAESTVIHYAQRAVDGDPGTSWVESAAGVGEGEWLLIRTKDGSKMNFSAIDFLIGYQKTQTLLDANGWPARLLIECEGGFFQEVRFYTCDHGVYECVLLDRPVETEWIKLTILEAQAGTAYEDTCISEIRPLGTDGDILYFKTDVPAQVVVPAETEPTVPVQEEPTIAAEETTTPTEPETTAPTQTVPVETESVLQTDAAMEPQETEESAAEKNTAWLWLAVGLGTAVLAVAALVLWKKRCM